MWWNDLVAGVMRTANRLVAFRDVILKTDDTTTLHVRNYNDTAYAKVNVLSYQKAGLDVDFWTDVTMFSWEADSTAGNALTTVATASQILGGYAQQSPGSLNDERDWLIYLNPGLYKLYSLHITGAGAPITTYSLYYSDGTLVQAIGTLDAYTAGSVFNVQALVGGGSFTVPKGDYYTLKGVVTGKNPSSGGFNFLHTKLRLARVG